MGYIEKNLLQGEDVIYRTSLHWIIYMNPLFLFAMGGACFWWSGIEQNQDGKIVIVIAGSTLLLVSLINGLTALIASFTSEFGVTNQRVLIKVGLIKRDTFELLLNKVESFQIKQTVLGRILSYGTILISGTGGGKDVFHNIDDPLVLKSRVQQSAKEYELYFSQSQAPALNEEKEVFSVADELRKLSDLMGQGILTEDEFEEQKRKLLDQ